MPFWFRMKGEVLGDVWYAGLTCCFGPRLTNAVATSNVVFWTQVKSFSASSTADLTIWLCAISFPRNSKYSLKVFPFVLHLSSMKDDAHCFPFSTPTLRTFWFPASTNNREMIFCRRFPLSYVPTFKGKENVVCTDGLRGTTCPEQFSGYFSGHKASLGLCDLIPIVNCIPPQHTGDRDAAATQLPVHREHLAWADHDWESEIGRLNIN